MKKITRIGVDKEIMDRHQVQGELHEARGKLEVEKHGLMPGGDPTPIEITKFMTASIAHILEKEFGKRLGDEGVRIVDPFCGTGVFVDTLITKMDYMTNAELARKWDSGELECIELLPEVAEMARAVLEDAYEKRMGVRRKCNFVHVADTFNVNPKTNLEYTEEEIKQHELDAVERKKQQARERRAKMKLLK